MRLKDGSSRDALCPWGGRPGLVAGHISPCLEKVQTPAPGTGTSCPILESWGPRSLEYKTLMRVGTLFHDSHRVPPTSQPWFTGVYRREGLPDVVGHFEHKDPFGPTEECLSGDFPGLCRFGHQSGSVPRRVDGRERTLPEPRSPPSGPCYGVRQEPDPSPSIKSVWSVADV